MRVLDFASLFVATVSLGCWVEPAPRRDRAAAPPATASPTPDTPPEDPPRLSIDTDRTLHVAPGEGAGFFVTYAAGGRWTISWTCDTAVSPGSTCPVELSVGTHGLSALESTPARIVDGQDATSFHVQTTTTTTIDSVTFQTEPGTSIAASFQLRGRPYPSLVFFVSGGALSTAPTDPVEFVPSDP